MRITPIALASLLLVALSACAPATDDGEKVTISWGIDNEKTDDTGRTTADVSFVVTKDDGKVHALPIGRYAGCGEQTAPEDGPLLTLKCWWAGGGDDFEVRMDATNVLAIDHRSVDEEAPIPEFTTLRTVALEDGVTIVPVAMKGL